MSPLQTPEALAQLAAPLRRIGLGLAALAAAAGALGALALAAWLVRLGVVRSPLWVPGAWVAALTAVAASLWLGGRAVRQVSGAALARALEASPGWRRGAVSAVLEGASPGTSADLYAAADRACAEAVSSNGPTALANLRTRWRRWSRWSRRRWWHRAGT